jgi:16S rRNA (guanine1516-N2)-methyltransferase
MSFNVSIICKDEATFEQAKELAEQFCIKLLWLKENPRSTNNNKVCLYFEDGRFVLKNNEGLSLIPSFTEDRHYRRTIQSPKKELISKACGWHLGYRSILDLTAGLAMDSVFLTQVGFQVTSLERHSALFLLLKSTQATAIKNDPKGIWPTLNFICTESLDYLKNQITIENAPEVIYYDPMYPSTTKSALPSKEMQIFRLLLGENEADVDLLELAITKTAKIVVVKRPIKAPPLQTNSNIGPTRSYIGKLVRYDIYAR